MKNSNWTREQLIVALNLYWKTPYNKISGSSNKYIKELAPILGRTPSALAFKLMNFTSFDAERQDKGNKGKKGAGAADKLVWQEYFGRWEDLAYDSAVILAQMQEKDIIEVVKRNEESAGEIETFFGKGIEKERLVKVRLNQSDFRRRILASYNETCCITGLNIPEFLVASHIVPWSKNEEERLNPRNGLCLNSLHDKAFDRGLITVTTDFKLKLSKAILKKKAEVSVQKHFLAYENQEIMLPARFTPSIDFLAYHHQNIFNK